MTEPLRDALDLRDETSPQASDVRLSKLVKCALGAGAVSTLSGLLAFGTGPIKSGWITPEIPDGLACAMFASVVAGIVAAVLGVAGAIRITCSHGWFRGYAMCAWGVGLAVLGNVLWVFAFGVALK